SGAVDLIFANESELKSLYETADFDTAVTALRNDVKLAVVTRSEKGCVVVSRESNEVVKAAPIDKLVDATGAGDLFAAGFLVGLARDQDHRTAVDQLEVTPERILLTHGHFDHAGGAAELAEALSVPIEGPDERDAFLLSTLEAQGPRFGITDSRNVMPDRWLVEGETVSIVD